MTNFLDKHFAEPFQVFIILVDVDVFVDRQPGEFLIVNREQFAVVG